MCVIIHNKKLSRRLTRDEFDSSWQRNPHWFWVMYSKDSRVIVKKSLDKEESFSLYNDAFDDANWGNVVTHFRMATHWPVTMDNTHPFYCGKDVNWWDMYLVHNGVLWYTDKNRPTWSDTRILAYSLSWKPKWYVVKQEWIDLINSLCSWDKILIMDSCWEVHYFWAQWVDIVEWENWIWASNTSPKPFFSSYGGSMKKFDDKDSTKKKSNPRNEDIRPQENTFVWVPKPEQETNEAFYYNWVLHCAGYYVDESGYVRYYNKS